MTDSRHYLSFVDQTLHYFTRAHESVPTAPIESPAAWRGSELPDLDELAIHLSQEEQQEIVNAVNHATALNTPTRELTAENFPLPLLQPKLAEWRERLKSGIGFVVLRGAPVQRWDQAESELFFWCFGLHLGRPGEQNPEGHLLGHVKNIVDDNETTERLYKTSSNIRFHCDAADAVGLLCLQKAPTGGQSRIASSVTVFNEIFAQRPELVARLFEPFQLDVRDGGMGANSIPVPPCCYDAGVLKTFYHADYFRSVTRHEGITLSTEEAELLDLYEEIANDSAVHIDMDLQPGDIQLISNHTVVHARTGYKDHSDPNKRRHLLRLWLSL